jgi:hypothetical protein
VNRRGAVLLTTLAALLLVGAVSAALLLAALHETFAARNAEAALVARSAAAAAVAQAAATGDAVAGALAVGDSAVVAGSFAGASYQARLLRAGDDLVAVRGIGVETGTGLRREVLAALRIVPLLPRRRAVALLRHPLAPALAAALSAADSAPPGWICPPPGAPAPPVIAASAPDSSHFGLGPLDWPALPAWTARPRSLDSLTPRTNAGGLTLTGGRSVGLLVVDGTLTLQGGVEVVGTVVARSGVVFGPGGATVRGAIVAESLGLVSGVTPSSVRVGYSACASGRTGRSGAPLRGLPGLPPLDVW